MSSSRRSPQPAFVSGWLWRGLLAIVAGICLLAAIVPASAETVLLPQTVQIERGSGTEPARHPVLIAASDQVKPYALIFGTVWAPDQRPAPDIHVRIQRIGEKKPRWELVSDARGEFAQRVPAGTADYAVWAEIKGRKEHAAEIKVHIQADERVDIGLHLAE
jgi:hypothetical protein